MPTPYEVLYGAFKVYTAPEAEAFPAINASPAGNWTLLGTNGDSNYDEEGLTISPSHETAKFTPVSKTVHTKKWTVAEGFMAQLNLVDMTGEQLSKVFNFNSVTNTVGPPAHKAFNLYRGPDISFKAVLLRADFSPYGASLKMQWEIYSADLSIEGDIEFKKDDAAKAGVVIEARLDGSSNFVVCRAAY